MKYFDRFFDSLDFYRLLPVPIDVNEEGLHVFLKSPHNKGFHEEINKWLSVGYKHGVQEIYKSRLSGRINTIDYYHVQSVLSELMCAHYFENILGLMIEEFHPPGNDNRRGDFLVQTSSITKLFVEVKFLWEKRIDGAFWYSYYAKISNTIRKTYKKFPRLILPTLLVIVDELNISPAFQDSELLQALYGKRAITFLVGPEGPLSEPEDKIIDRRSAFQRKIRTSFGAVAVLNFSIRNDKKYIFKVYHNPFCESVCSIPIDVFAGKPQFVLDENESKMIWINDNQYT